MDGAGEIAVRVRRYLHGTVVGADEHWILSGQPLRRSDADAWATRPIARVVLAPQLPPTGVHNRRITRLERELLAGQRLLQILNGYFVRVWKHLDALHGCDIDQDATRDQGTNIL